MAARPVHALIAAGFAGILPAVLAAQQAGWGNLGKQAPKGFSWTDPLWPGFWMAWTPITFALFVALFATLGLMTVIEILYPGGAKRRGVLGLVTTRGDRLFLTLLGTVYVFLAWLGFVGEAKLLIPLGISALWGVFCFLKV